MNYGFTLSNVQAPDYGEIIAALPFGGVICTEDPASFPNGHWPRGTVFLYADKVSSRPVECHYDGEGLKVRILGPSSPADYELALSLVEQLALHQGASVAPQDGAPLDVGQFRSRYGKEWIAQHCPATLQAVISSCRQEDVEITLPGARRDLRLGPRLLASLPEDPEQLTQEFFERFRRLQYIDQSDIFLAPAITLRNDLGTRTITVAVLSEGVPTVLSDEIDAVILRGRNGETLQIASDALLELIGSDHMRLSEDLLLVEIQEGGPWRELLDNAAQHHLEDLFVIGTELGDASSGQLSAIDEGAELDPEALSALAMGPFLAFLLVAGADGPVTREQAVRFTEALAAAVRQRKGAVGAILTDALKNFTSHLSELTRDPNLIERIRDLVEVVDRTLPSAPSASYRMTLLMLAREVTQESTGGPDSRTPSDREHKALAALAVLLELAH
jgi:hypothetical protein